MDLEKIKKEWQQAEVKPVVSEEIIGKMIDNEGQSAFNKLFRYEKFSFVMLILIIPLTFTMRMIEVQIVTWVSLFFIFLWQIYKFRFLRKIDLLRMSVMEISGFYLRYKKYTIYELILSIAWFFGFTGFFGFMQYKYDKEYFMEFGIYVFVIVFAIAFIVALWLIWKLSLKNLRQLGRSVYILEEMEKNEEEENSNLEQK